LGGVEKDNIYYRERRDKKLVGQKGQI